MKSPANKSVQQHTRIFQMALFSALAATLHILETYISLPLPFFRVGLSNVIILLFIFNQSYLTAFFIALNKSLLGNFFTGKLLSFAFVMSLSGSLISTVFMIILYSSFKNFFSKNIISISGAVINNLSQYLLFIFLIDKNSDITFSTISSTIILFSIISGMLNSVIVYKLLIKMKMRLI